MADVAKETKSTATRHPEEESKGKESKGKESRGKESKGGGNDAAPRSSPAPAKDIQHEEGHSDEDSTQDNYTHEKEKVEDLGPKESTEVSEGGEGQDIQEEAKKAKEAKLSESSKNAKDATAQKAKEAFDLASRKKPSSKSQDDEGKKSKEKEEGKEGEKPKKSKEEQEGDKEEKSQQSKEEVEGPKDEKPDYSILKNAKVNKGGNLVSEANDIVGRVKEGVLTHLVGKRSDENGNIWNDSGKVIGKAELIPDDEREAMQKEPAPFESFSDAVVDSKGNVVSGDKIIGRVVEGDVKVLEGKSVDPDGEVLDRKGNVIGKAERSEPEPEPEPEAEPDRSILAGKRVNKAGNVVDSHGNIFGRVVEGDVKSMAGRMCDKKGNIVNEMGEVMGKAEVVPEGEREGQKEGPFAELTGCTVSKDGKIVTPGGDVVGRLVSGDPKTLYGRTVDEDGDVCDKNGNVLGKAERWEEPEVEKKKNRMSGRRVNREGNVVDEDGNIIGKLTSGDLSACAGNEIDDDGDVVNSKGNTVGHASLLEDIPQEQESAEDKEQREKLDQDKKLAAQMAGCLEQCLDKIKPICNMITEKIQRADRTPKEELDEEELVKEVKPLIEEGGKILTEANGIIRGLDPDGRIQAKAKAKTASREATPEEYHLAEVLKELTQTVAKCIDDAKKRIEGMPHAKKELNPLWGLLNEPLFQILAAVGLLLSGVLNLVGRLLSGLGLGGIIDGLLGTLGLNRVLDNLGLGSVTEALTGGKKKK